MSVAISVENLGKSYVISHNREAHSTLAETLLHRARRPFERVERETFWALKDLSFEVKQGDVVGIIGRNGAGKSTLLKILSRITEPTTGEARLYGRVGSLLEVGTGFHPELTGRENVYLNGQILGMRRKEIERQFDAIVDFAGVEKFLDTPVKRYSSGMYVRLAFAVAAHLQSEILVVDEVLAVGDAEFQRKCLGKMKDVATGGRTVLFVSHHMQSVKVLCQQAMFLEKGTCAYLGEVSGAIGRYSASFETPQAAATDVDRRPGSGEWRFTGVGTDKETYHCSERKRIRFRAERRRGSSGAMHISCHVYDPSGFNILHCDSRMNGFTIAAEDAFEAELTLESPWLKPGTYRVELLLCSAGIIDRLEYACFLNVIPLLPYEASANEEATASGVVFADFRYAELGRDRAAARGEPALARGGGEENR